MKTSFSNTLSLWVLPGLISGAVFLAIALLAGALTTTVWAMPDAIAQALGIAAPADYGFALVPVLVGVTVHLTFSIGLAAIFTACVRRLRLHGWTLVVAGFILVNIETPVALWVVLHSVLSATTFHFLLAAIPFWGSALGRYTYGLLLGLLLALHPSTAAYKSQQPTVSLGTRE